jgi:hypothetical protein
MYWPTSVVVAASQFSEMGGVGATACAGEVAGVAVVEALPTTVVGVSALPPQPVSAKTLAADAAATQRSAWSSKEGNDVVVPAEKRLCIGKNL